MSDPEVLYHCAFAGIRAPKSTVYHLVVPGWSDTLCDIEFSRQAGAKSWDDYMPGLELEPVPCCSNCIRSDAFIGIHNQMHGHIRSVPEHKRPNDAATRAGL